MIISLTGFMGCGKSSVGRELSRLLCCRFMDLDSVIEAREGRSIPEIFASDGEAAFRNIEKIVLSDIISANTERLIAPLAPSHFVGPSPYAGVRKCQFRKTATPQLPAEIITDNNSSQETADCAKANAPEETLVLALGGGTVMTPECAEIVRKHTTCIYLCTGVEALIERLADEADGRPMLGSTSSPASSDMALRGAERHGNLRTRIEELIFMRSVTYEQTAHMTVVTDGKTIEEVAEEISGFLLGKC